jgi:hypothetical protein
MLTRARWASQSFWYVLPSQPQTAPSVPEQLVGGMTHPPPAAPHPTVWQ